jgi:hypothetical protein
MPVGDARGAVSLIACSARPIVARPGCTANTAMPGFFVSTARFSASLISAALETEYAVTYGQ